MIKEIALWVRLLFNRNQSMVDAINRGKKAVWLTTGKWGTRINYYNPGGAFWGGSDPIEKCGAFRYRTFVKIRGKKEFGEYATQWASKVLS